MKEAAYQEVKRECRNYAARLVVVSKFRSNEEIQSYYDAGQRDFAENRVQELVKKHEELPKDIRWHMIGHLQTNKVKYIAPFIDTIHSVSSYALIDEIEKQAAKVDRKIPCYIEFNLSEEESKSGFAEHEWEDVMNTIIKRKHISTEGIMVMGPNTDDQEEILNVFNRADNLRKTIALAYPYVQELSMGMSQDYKLALQLGSTVVRVGSLLFE